MFEVTWSVPGVHTHLVSEFFTSGYPPIQPEKGRTEWELVTQAILGTKQVRYGPAPRAQSIKCIHATVKHAMEEGCAIPILMPWGSRKTLSHESLDIAEVAALKQLKALNQRVRRYYPSGIQIRIRLDDVSGFHLFADEGEQARTHSIRYCDTFCRLVRVMGLTDFIRPVSETDLFTETAFNAAADAAMPLIHDYIMASDTDWDGDCAQTLRRQLNKAGWNGDIPMFQRNFLRERFQAIYGVGVNVTEKLVRYLAGSLARVQLSNSGADKSWGQDYLRVTFLATIPGTPPAIADRMIHYRTLPRSVTENHAPAWRSKGYLEVDCVKSVAIPKLASWLEPRDYVQQTAILSSEMEQVEVRSDILITEA